MTLALAVRCRDGIVIAADSRGVSGTAYLDGVDKITRIARNACVAVSGSNASVGIPYIRDLVRAMHLSTDRDVDVHNVGRGLERLLNTGLASAANPLEEAVSAVRFLIAGYLGDGVSAVYSLVAGPLFPMFCLLDQPEGHNKIGEEGLVTYYIKASGKEPSALSCQEVAPLVHFIIQETKTVRITVGGPLRMFFIRETDVEEVDPEAYRDASARASEGIRHSVREILTASENHPD